MSNPSRNLLDEALDLDGDDVAIYRSSGSGRGCGRVLLIEDCVETSGAFILHHLMKRSLSPQHPSDILIFFSFAHPFSHYDRILRKMGCNLVVQRDNKRFLYHDMLMPKSPGIDGDQEKAIESMLLGLYGKVQRTVELCSLPEGEKNIIIMIDDLSLMEVATNCSSSHVLDFLHYCYSLTTEFGCSIVILNHWDIYSSIERPNPLIQMEYFANVVIKAEPLGTGLASDVHGQLTVLNKRVFQGTGGSKGKIRNFHFRVKESHVEYFHPGSRT